MFEDRDAAAARPLWLVAEGDLVMLLGFGAGLTYGGSVVRL